MSGRIRAIVFVVVLLAAVGLAGRSLFMKAETQVGGDTGGFDVAVEKAVSSVPAEKAAACGLSLDAISSINKLAADKNCVFILVPGESEEKTHEAAGYIDEAIEKITARGVQVGTFTLKKDGTDYAEMVKMLSVQSLPSVLVMGKDCGSTVVSNGVTEEKLLRAYVLASVPAGTCGPSGCAP